MVKENEMRKDAETRSFQFTINLKLGISSVSSYSSNAPIYFLFILSLK